jgi:FkbM family methyltransferase
MPSSSELPASSPAPAPDEERALQLVREFFGGKRGFFVEVGANHPYLGSQSWHLEQRGWRGCLIEPQPELAERLRQTRSAKVFAAACSSPENRGQRLPFYLAGPLSALDRARMAPGSSVDAVIDVPVSTLDDLLSEAGSPQPLDLLSVDVEGHEIEVLRGFDFARWQPRLILIEDHVGNLQKHRFMKASGYRLVRRTGYNGWYVPFDSPVHFGFSDQMQVLRKYYLGLPFRILRNFSRRLRQPFKDRMRARRQKSRAPTAQ